MGRLRVLVVGLVVVGAVLVPSAVAVAQTPSGAPSSGFAERAVCGRPGRVDEARCFAHVRTHATTGRPAATTGPARDSPVQLPTAYGLNGAAASGRGGPSRVG